MYFFLPFHWPRAHQLTRDNCLQIIVLLQIRICSYLIETTILCENGGSVPRAGREWFDMFSWSKEQWSNNKTIIELDYCKISWCATISKINYLQLFIFDLLVTDKSRYFAQHHSIIVIKIITIEYRKDNAKAKTRWKKIRIFNWPQLPQRHQWFEY